MEKDLVMGQNTRGSRQIIILVSEVQFWVLGNQ